MEINKFITTLGLTAVFMGGVQEGIKAQTVEGLDAAPKNEHQFQQSVDEAKAEAQKFVINVGDTRHPDLYQSWKIPKYSPGQEITVGNLNQKIGNIKSDEDVTKGRQFTVETLATRSYPKEEGKKEKPSETYLGFGFEGSGDFVMRDGVTYPRKKKVSEIGGYIDPKSLCKDGSEFTPNTELPTKTSRTEYVIEESANLRGNPNTTIGTCEPTKN